MSKSLQEQLQEFSSAIEKLGQQEEERAKSRSEMIDQAADNLVGGIIEFYTARIAVKNGVPSDDAWIEHWMGEANRNLGQRFEEHLSNIRRVASNIDKAFKEIEVLVFENDSTSRRAAINKAIKDYASSTIKFDIGANDDDSKAYFDLMIARFEECKKKRFR